MRRKKKCGSCPKFDRGWCTHRAEMRPPDAPPCEFGLRQMRNAYSAEWMRRKHGFKKKGEES